MNRLRRAGYLKPDDLTAETLAQAADDALFSAVQNNELHVLRGLCPVQREPLYNSYFDEHTISPSSTKTRWTLFLECYIKVVDTVTPDVTVYTGLESRPLRNWSMHVTWFCGRERSRSINTPESGGRLLTMFSNDDTNPNPDPNRPSRRLTWP